MQDRLGDRMKMYESEEASRKLPYGLPIIARIDGRAFHSFTHGMTKPYEDKMVCCMLGTTKALVEETGACIGYTQSDEISLVWQPNTIEHQIWFDGKIHKMVSNLAALASVHFYALLSKHNLTEYRKKMPSFDARIWTVPSKMEAINCILWRQLDANKNAISMAASTYFSHKQLLNKNSDEKKAMLMTLEIDFDHKYPDYFKNGSFIRRKLASWPFTTEEIEKLPPKHEARTNPNLMVERHYIEVPKLPLLSKIENAIEVIFESADPILK